MLAQLAFDRISHLTSLVMNKLAVSAQLPCYCYLRPTQCRPGWKVKKKIFYPVYITKWFSYSLRKLDRKVFSERNLQLLMSPFLFSWDFAGIWPVHGLGPQEQSCFWTLESPDKPQRKVLH